jgi:hypothetical protein
VGNLFLASLPSETAKVHFQWLSGSSYVRSNSEAATKKPIPRLLSSRNGFLRLYSFCHSCPLCHSCESRSPFLSMLLPFKEIPAFAGMTTGENRFVPQSLRRFPPAGATNPASQKTAFRKLYERMLRSYCSRRVATSLTRAASRESF